MSVWIWVLIGLLSWAVLKIISCVINSDFCLYDRHMFVGNWSWLYGFFFAVLGVGIMGTITLNPWWGFAIGGGVLGMFVSSWHFEKYLSML